MKRSGQEETTQRRRKIEIEILLNWRRYQDKIVAQPEKKYSC